MYSTAAQTLSLVLLQPFVATVSSIMHSGLSLQTTHPGHSLCVHVTWLSAGSIYITIANNGYQSDYVATGALDCCSNITGTAACESSSGISVSPTQNVSIASQTSYQYVFNISKALL